MLKILTAFVELFNTLFNLIVNAVKSIVILVTSIPTYAAFTIDAINVLPAVLIPFAAASISVTIILFVLGRNK